MSKQESGPAPLRPVCPHCNTSDAVHLKWVAERSCAPEIAVLQCLNWSCPGITWTPDLTLPEWGSSAPSVIAWARSLPKALLRERVPTHADARRYGHGA